MSVDSTKRGIEGSVGPSKWELADRCTKDEEVIQVVINGKSWILKHRWSLYTSRTFIRNVYYCLCSQFGEKCYVWRHTCNGSNSACPYTCIATLSMILHMNSSSSRMSTRRRACQAHGWLATSGCAGWVCLIGFAKKMNLIWTIDRDSPFEWDSKTQASFSLLSRGITLRN